MQYKFINIYCECGDKLDNSVLVGRKRVKISTGLEIAF